MGNLFSSQLRRVRLLRPRLAGRRARRGFTILEVMMAAFVLAMGIATSITALQYGMRAVDTARNMTLAGQIMQSEMEILRLQNWTQVLALVGRNRVDPSTTITSGTSTTLDSTLTSIASRFECYREVATIPSRSNILLITLSVTWTGLDGRAHAMSYQTRYAKNGISDYFYVAH
jgi:prepilin-type N-terminal cleavage/methylation domain-containing protein